MVVASTPPNPRRPRLQRQPVNRVRRLRLRRRFDGVQMDGRRLAEIIVAIVGLAVLVGFFLWIMWVINGIGYG